MVTHLVWAVIYDANNHFFYLIASEALFPFVFVFSVLIRGLIAVLLKLDPGEVPVAEGLVERFLAASMGQHHHVRSAHGAQAEEVGQLQQVAEGRIGVRYAEVTRHLLRQALALLAGAHAEKAHVGGLGQVALGEPRGLPQALEGLPQRGVGQPGLSQGPS